MAVFSRRSILPQSMPNPPHTGKRELDTARPAWVNAPMSSDTEVRDTPFTTLRDQHVRNMAALYRVDLDLARRLDALPFSACPPLEPTTDGAYTVRLPADDGRPNYLHSRRQPRAEAAKLVAALADADVPTFAVFGAGLGYTLTELETRFTRPVIVAFEPDLALLKAALCVTDIAPLLDDGRLLLLNTADKQPVYDKLQKINADLLLGLQLLATPISTRMHAPFHAAARQQLADFLTYAQTQILTLVQTTRTTMRNLIQNLPPYLAQPGVETLANRARGYPAIIVAAGPSLARHVRRLPELQDRAVIISVQTVFKLLRDIGVDPHFVTSLDYHEVSREFFRNVDSVGRCALVAEPKGTPAVVRNYPGRVHVLQNDLHDTLLADAGPKRGSLRGGSTVAHLAFYLAEHLGCDPIIFVGQDLAFSEGLFYLPGSPIEDIWAHELGRFYTLEMKQWERIVRNRGILRPIRDVHGRPTYTDNLLFSYAEQFQNDFVRCRARVIQATEGGAPFVGAETMTLDDAVAQYCTRPLPPDLFDAAQTSAQSADATAARAALEQRRRELTEIRTIADEMTGLLTELVALVEKPDKFNRLIGRVDALRNRMRRYNTLYNVVTRFSAQAELQRYRADRAIGRTAQEDAATARKRLERDQQFVASFREGCELLDELLAEGLADWEGAFA